jgi:Fe2+ transport system protein FeoA
MEMGLIAGKEVRVLFRAPFGDPIAIDVHGYVLSLRLDEAGLIQVNETIGSEVFA